MAQIRHIDNRCYVIFSCRGWSDLDKISLTGAEWHVDCVIWPRSKADVELQYGQRLREFMAWHPRATYHIAWCCHGANSLSWFHMPDCRVLPPGEINDIIPERRVTLHGRPTANWWIHCHDVKATCRIAPCKNSIRHIEHCFSPYFIFRFSYISLGFDERRLSYRLR